MTIRKAYADISAGQVHYRYSPGPGTPVLFFHRTPVWSSSFDRVMAQLDGWRGLYAFDTPGSGESFTPAGPSSVTAFRDWFIKAIDALGIAEFHLCGHHTGAHFAVEIAAYLPKRTKSLMIDGPMYLTAEEREAARENRGPGPEIDKAGDFITKAWNFILPFYPTFSPAEVFQEFVGAMRSLPNRPIWMNTMLDQDYPERLAKVTSPVLAFAAEDDVYAPLLSKIAADCPAVTTKTYGKAGIAGPELQAAAFAQIVRDFAEQAERS